MGIPTGFVPDGTSTSPCHWVVTPGTAEVGAMPQRRQMFDGEQEDELDVDVVLVLLDEVVAVVVVEPLLVVVVELVVADDEDVVEVDVVVVVLMPPRI
jgi:hypothetical protein